MKKQKKSIVFFIISIICISSHASKKGSPLSENKEEGSDGQNHQVDQHINEQNLNSHAAKIQKESLGPLKKQGVEKAENRSSISSPLLKNDGIISPSPLPPVPLFNKVGEKNIFVKQKEKDPTQKQNIPPPQEPGVLNFKSAKDL